jgi:HD-GYP domain-containing protein (c-di-GMP phosphodiesterase class II)
MFVVKLDQPWYKTPFLKHRFLIRSVDDIRRLHKAGIQTVEIDPSRSSHVLTDACENLPASEKSAVSPAPPISSSLENLGHHLQRAREASSRLCKSVDSVFQDLALQSRLHSDQVNDLVREIVIVHRSLDNAAALMIACNDTETGMAQHAFRVSTLALLLGEALEYDFTRLQGLAAGALLHDIGLIKLGLPHLTRENVLVSPKRDRFLDHPREGAMFLESLGSIPRSAVRVVAEHHAIQGVNGYPKEIPAYSTTEESRIVMIVDRFDEISLNAEHRSVQGASEALFQEAQCQQLDFRLATQLIRLIGIYPVYSLVELNTGQRGIVTRVSPHNLYCPTVTLVYDTNGERFPDPIEVDLAGQAREPEGRRITKVLNPHKEEHKIDAFLQRTAFSNEAVS